MKQLDPAQCRAARVLIGWNQTRLAKAAGVSLSTVSDFEKGLRLPIPNNLVAIRNALETAGVKFKTTDFDNWIGAALHERAKATVKADGKGGRVRGALKKLAVAKSGAGKRTQ